MGYFPFFMDMEGRHGLIVGGGAIALRKTEKLLPFGPVLTVAAPSILPTLAALPGVTAAERAFDGSMLEGMDFAIAATDSRETNRAVSALCRARNIPVNTVDDPEACTFLFPALVRRGTLCVGISTGGASPAAAAWLRGQIEAMLSEKFGDILEYMGKLRPWLKAMAEDEQSRGALMKALFAACMEAGRPLTEAELAAFLREERL